MWFSTRCGECEHVNYIYYEDVPHRRIGFICCYCSFRQCWNGDGAVFEVALGPSVEPLFGKMKPDMWRLGSRELTNAAT